MIFRYKIMFVTNIILVSDENSYFYIILFVFFKFKLKRVRNYCILKPNIHYQVGKDHFKGITYSEIRD